FAVIVTELKLRDVQRHIFGAHLLGRAGGFQGVDQKEAIQGPRSLDPPILSQGTNQARRGSRKRPDPRRWWGQRAGAWHNAHDWRVERVMPERVIPQKRLAAAPIRACWLANVKGWGAVVSPPVCFSVRLSPHEDSNSLHLPRRYLDA